MKTILDMSLPPRLATLLAENEIESEHWYYYIGEPDAKDTEIMEYAYENDCAVLLSSMPIPSLK